MNTATILTVCTLVYAYNCIAPNQLTYKLCNEITGLETPLIEQSCRQLSGSSWYLVANTQLDLSDFVVVERRDDQEVADREWLAGLVFNVNGSWLFSNPHYNAFVTLRYGKEVGKESMYLIEIEVEEVEYLQANLLALYGVSDRIHLVRTLWTEGGEILDLLTTSFREVRELRVITLPLLECSKPIFVPHRLEFTEPDRWLHIVGRDNGVKIWDKHTESDCVEISIQLNPEDTLETYINGDCFKLYQRITTEFQAYLSRVFRDMDESTFEEEWLQEPKLWGVPKYIAEDRWYTANILPILLELGAHVELSMPAYQCIAMGKN